MNAISIPAFGRHFTVDDPEAWRALFPALRVCDPASAEHFRPFDTDEATLAALRTLIQTEGYFQLDPPPWPLPLSGMGEAVAGLHRNGLPTGFAFIFDEFWLLFFNLHHLLCGILGPDYRLRPDFWAWCIDPAAEESGWLPHRDQALGTLRPDRSPKSLSMWVPLTDATPLNGCMYVLPADRDPHYDKDDKVAVNLPDIRALPARAGSILGWPPPLLHWGSHACKRGGEPRISVAYEFQRGDEPPFREPLLAPLQMPSFGVRLALVAKQVLQYQHMYPLTPEILNLMEALVSR